MVWGRNMNWAVINRYHAISILEEPKILWQINIFLRRRIEQSNKLPGSFCGCSCLFMCFVIIPLIVITFFLCLPLFPFSQLSRLQTCFTFSNRLDFSQRSLGCCLCYKEIVDFNFFYIGGRLVVCMFKFRLKFITAQPSGERLKYQHSRLSSLWRCSGDPWEVFWIKLPGTFLTNQ